LHIQLLKILKINEKNKLLIFRIQVAAITTQLARIFHIQVAAITTQLARIFHIQVAAIIFHLEQLLADQYPAENKVSN
jgi:hypothetical protein